MKISRRLAVFQGNVHLSKITTTGSCGVPHSKLGRILTGTGLRVAAWVGMLVDAGRYLGSVAENIAGGAAIEALLVLGSAYLMWTSTLWLLIGTPLWVFDSLNREELPVTAVLTHFVAAGLGLWCVRRIGRVRNGWIVASGFGICLQVVSHYATPTLLNVNVSHAIYPALSAWFDSYWLYAVSNALTLAAVLFGVEKIMQRLWCRPPDAARAR